MLGEEQQSVIVDSIQNQYTTTCINFLKPLFDSAQGKFIQVAHRY